MCTATAEVNRCGAPGASAAPNCLATDAEVNAVNAALDGARNDHGLRVWFTQGPSALGSLDLARLNGAKILMWHGLADNSIPWRQNVYYHDAGCFAGSHRPPFTTASATRTSRPVSPAAGTFKRWKSSATV